MKAKNGISLIVLVITIVVIIILAAAVILSLGNNNPINSSKVAKLTQSKDNIESAMSIFISSQWAKTAAEVDTDAETLVTKTTSTSIPSPICSTSNAFTDSTETASKVKTGVAYAITDEGWSALNVSKPTEGEAWYYAPATGKVYVKMDKVPDYASDNDTVKGFIVTAE